ncbi:hypothetical protein DPMN_151289 [Dreissena polymorpha]|uniref:Uncharacterized protein n=1 Tax=Dreissena polymorpha TaxID=45954 RepID=A0A9D4J6T7_DREPO|nr:hypothetical protein DPMN_151289 [Dreissena polymorpha]
MVDEVEGACGRTDQIEAIQRLMNVNPDNDRLGLREGASKYINFLKIQFRRKVATFYKPVVLERISYKYDKYFITNSIDEENKAYKRLAVLLRPDKNVAPGCEDAFKILLAARTALLKQ